MKIFGEHDPKVIEQLQNCLDVEEGSEGVLCADGHLGYSQPIGGAVAYREHISPSGVGYDIGCGNKAVRTNLTAEDIDGQVPFLMDEIFSRISFGMGRTNDKRVDHEVLDQIRDAPFAPQRGLLTLAQGQLGTVGAGNHYVDLFRDERDRIWVGVHFGSRGFGHKTASGFLAMAQGKDFGGRVPDGEMMSPPVAFPTDSAIGQSYIEAMTLAGKYAYAGRDVVCDKVLEILGAVAVDEVHNHHNYAWREEHLRENFWVVRKGCTPAFPGQRGFVGATMGEDAVILEGNDPPDDTPYELRKELYLEQEAGLFSTVHGAGRTMSRTKAAGKERTVAVCSDRDCDYWKPWGQFRHETEGLRPDQIEFCPDHPKNRALKRRMRTQVGAIDWEATKVDLNLKGIQLRGGAADEAPGAYKRLDEVLAVHGDTIRVLHRLTPIGVAMAGEGTYDAYKD